MICLKNARVFDGISFVKQKNIIISDGKIKDLTSRQPNKNIKTVFDLKGNIVVPGFIDIQLNGGGGCFFNETPTENALLKISRAHIIHGVTSYLPTLITDDFLKISQAVLTIKDCVKKFLPGILGIHFEGPFINKEKNGIHSKQYIRTPTIDEIQLMTSVKNAVTLITLAPEVIEKSILKAFRQKKVILFAGHTNATFAQMNEAFKQGVKGVTHLFNACSQFGSREPGVVGASLLHDDSWCGIIADGQHVSFESLKLAFKVKNNKKFILVSDTMAPFGTDMKRFYINEKEIFVKDGKYINADGTLAGSAISVYEAFKNIVTQKLVTLEEALPMTSTNAAECLGIDGSKKSILKKGRLLPEFDADLVVLDSKNLRIKSVIQFGKIII
ncbi:N-acetylglucosamine-6-phosphate deacetylase [Fluviispira multicolorata]|uniref:N-acetylglucosamine-6-phosphate deacetylase n=1 Tax=Fluviispira multicolorata TaxID=2654512 RepID=A0A833N238_9BACT|nr:N-acetylglucosamine-6-phosphate deacetylase [Fluviispira multicolorata]KAB8031957.1 N-acetylglucosamine-6-phosphate deacetylase [Fluviispira multicolorata]